MLIKTAGIVLNEYSTGDNDKYVVILTKDIGVINAYAKGSKRIVSKLSSITSPYTYSNFVLYKGRDSYYIDDGDIIDIFAPIRQDIIKLSMVAYLCDLSKNLCKEEENCSEQLRLLLNCMHYLSQDTINPMLIKSIFEIRLMVLSGFQPDLVCCEKCAAYEEPIMYFSVKSGRLICHNCYTSVISRYDAIKVNRATLAAFRHIVYSPTNKLFSFLLEKCYVQELNAISEEYVLFHTDKKLKTLDFLYSVINF